MAQSPEVEFLEERLALLREWLDSTNVDSDDEITEELIQKREKYEGLIEEYQDLIHDTHLLQRKLRKTTKLLSNETCETTRLYLTRKQKKYDSEIDVIMNYAESDVLFEESDTVEDEEIEPNELLGEPLETLIEQPGLEGESYSHSLNFSISDFLPKTSTMLTKALHRSLASLDSSFRSRGE